jgi:hypothetical protein
MLGCWWNHLGLILVVRFGWVFGSVVVVGVICTVEEVVEIGKGRVIIVYF